VSPPRPADVPAHLRGAISPDAWDDFVRADVAVGELEHEIADVRDQVTYAQAVVMLADTSRHGLPELTAAVVELVDVAACERMLEASPVWPDHDRAMEISIDLAMELLCVDFQAGREAVGD